MADWFEDEWFWKTFYGFMFSPEKFVAAEGEVKKVIQLTGFQGKNVLDLACGPGRHAVPLAQQGYSVTGIDGSNYLLEKAKRYAAEKAVDVEWVHQDMRNFVRENSFELAMSLFTSFGYFERKEEDFLVIQNIFHTLKPGGICIMDVMGKERFAKVYEPTITHQLSDGSLLIERPKVVEDWTRIHNQWLLIQGNNVHKFDFRLCIYSGQELKNLFLQAGFHSVQLYGDLDGSEYGPQATRLVLLARKPT